MLKSLIRKHNQPLQQVIRRPTNMRFSHYGHFPFFAFILYTFGLNIVTFLKKMDILWQRTCKNCYM